MNALETVTLAHCWTGQSVGGWLVIEDRWRVRCAVELRAVSKVGWVAVDRRGRPGELVLSIGDETFRCPADEVATARVRRWWRTSRDRRAAAPRWCAVPDLIHDAASHGGQRWISEVALAVGPGGTGCLLAPGGSARGPQTGAHRIDLRPGSADVDRLAAAALRSRPGASWCTIHGVATYVFDWSGPFTIHKGAKQRIGVVDLERFRPDDRHSGAGRPGRVSER